MAAQRLPAQDRRTSILDAATAMFARYGLEGTRTQRIAQAAGVSEALIFRHFATKRALYRAVLRNLIRQQNATFAAFGPIAPSAEGLMTMIEKTIRHALRGGEAHNAEGMRMVVSSLASDGEYARLVYRRALRLVLPDLSRALSAARDQGVLTAAELDPASVTAFIEHVATMLLLARTHRPPTISYAADDTRTLRDAVRFCARGIGFDAAWVDALTDRLHA